ncbi:endonuclease/exonuclease/phosphatase family protein [Brachybacterium sp. NBEC-018]|uniref:endonuclease/exonuclease/phosphatase family protein n=1 Tax=Brachybacterium sp. NBEC-018 TaxID=2996004 RepID=UPI002174F8E2|nr:endonuclease/exonuclease/phosphatase family protein [Brachybacterium sp. NBEC-018]UVY83428.1 endonuclease/exonuclease/phosphatase family protein [Brachybacterium sp. NBEC-018]
MSAVRVASVNIHHGADARGRLDLARTAAAIAATGADLVALQEVDVRFGERSLHEDQAALLGEALGMHVRFGAAIPRGEGDGYGLALLSRAPIGEAVMHPLPGASGPRPLREPRGLLDAQVELPGEGTVRVLVTHLDHDHRSHRDVQVREILRLVAEDAGPVVLLGDLNADPSAPELAGLRLRGFRDAAIEVARERRRGTVARAPGGTAPGRALSRAARVLSLARAVVPHGPVRATWPVRVPLRRLDAIWLRGPVRARELRVVRTAATDHRLLVARLELDRPARGQGQGQ